MSSLLESINLRDPAAVIDALTRGARANRTARCRRGSIDLVELAPDQQGTPAATLIATGDLHDNPLHLARLLSAAGIEDERSDPAHLTLHELIHGDRLVNGLDYSYRVLVRVAHLKSVFPERIHVLLANHELAQAFGQQVAKEGIRCNEAFDEALDVQFNDDAPSVRAAIIDFVRSMPLAVRFRCAGASGDILCAHSVPPPELMDRFDMGVLNRTGELTDDDYAPRRGSAHLMVWGRNQTPDQLRALADRWNIRLFILGHEKAEEGSLILEPNALILNSDHDRGVYAKVDLCDARTVHAITQHIRPLAQL